jgi:hypothetical protein
MGDNFSILVILGSNILGRMEGSFFRKFFKGKKIRILGRTMCFPDSAEEMLKTVNERHPFFF